MQFTIISSVLPVVKGILVFLYSFFFLIPSLFSRPSPARRTAKKKSVPQDALPYFRFSRLYPIACAIRLRPSDQYMPPMPPPMPGLAAGAGFSSFFSDTTASVVRTVAATDAAFFNALLVTFAGSTIPVSIISA